MMDKDSIKRDSINYDSVIVGAGPAGLATAIKLKQLNKDLTVCVLEKSAAVGGHILSGNIFETRALDELIPDWKEKKAPINTKVTKEQFLFLSEKLSIKIPHWLFIKSQKNRNNYIISLANLCRWLAKQAEKLEVDVLPSFAASEILYSKNGAVCGVQTGDKGVDKNGKPKDNFQAGINIHAKVVVFAEGCRGHLGKQLIAKFNLDKNSSVQQYGIGFKEIWEIDLKKHKEGLVSHSVGWPLSHNIYGGSFCYHAQNNQVFIGYVIGLCYKNPYLSPYDEFQKFKTHPIIRKLLSGGKRIAYGAKAVIEGGLPSLPKMHLPGALLIGCDAGTLNVAKAKGTHTAMKSGMLAAEIINDNIVNGIDLSAYEAKFKASWVYKELKQTRNVKPSFRFGLLPALVVIAIEQIIFRGKLPFTFKYKLANYESLLPACKVMRIKYPKYDNLITFDKNSSVYLTSVGHVENQPLHLQLKNKQLPINYTLDKYAEPAQRYCPVGVYEVRADSKSSKLEFVINSQNCIHCKVCDIKEPSQNINWVTPEGGDGPNYTNM